MSTPAKEKPNDWIETGETDLGIPYKRLFTPKGKLAIEIFFFDDPDPDEPEAAALFLRHIKTFNPDEWRTWGADSLTAMERAFRQYQMKVVQAGSKHPMKWFAGATDMVEQLLCMRVASWPCNVVVTAHISEDDVTTIDQTTGRTVRVTKRVEGGETEEGQKVRLRGISAPGRLAKKHVLTAAFAEVYHLFKRGEDIVVQTEGDGEWVAQSQCGFDETVFKKGELPSFREMGLEKDDEPIHTILYGLPGTLKSTMTATMPFPMHIDFFDGRGGKDKPYVRRVRELHK